MAEGRARGAWLIGAALVAALGWVLAGDTITRSDDDLDVFLRAAERAVRGEHLYPPADGEMAFKYAPATAFFFLPWARAVPGMRSLAWYAFSCACLIAALAVFWGGVMGRRAPRRPREAAPLLLALGVGQAFLHYHLRNGQTDAAILLLGVLAGWAARRRPLAAGALCTGAAALKVVPAVVWPFVARSHWRRALLGAVLAGVVVLAVPVLAWGPRAALQQHLGWVACLGTRTPGDLLYHRNQSIPAFARRALGDGALASLAAAGLVLTAAALAVQAARRAPETDDGRALALAAGLGLVPVLSPVSWPATCVLLLPALVVLRAAPRGGADEVLYWLAAVLFNVAGGKEVQDLAPRLWGGLLVLAALLRRAGSAQGTAQLGPGTSLLAS